MNKAETYLLILLISNYYYTSIICLALSSSTKNTKQAPRRLKENVPGVLYVNEACIDCTTCACFAPEVFKRGPNFKHMVHTQPTSIHNNKQSDASKEDEIERVRAAIAACPVAAIKLDKANGEDERVVKAELTLNEKVSGRRKPFPRAFLPDELENRVWYVGYNNEKTFGATPYVVKADDGVTVLVDIPRYGPNAIKSIVEICGEGGPDYLFITHVDDSTDHKKWKDHFQKCKRIFHSGDLGMYNWIGDKTLEDVEILLSGTSNIHAEGDVKKMSLKMWTLDGEELKLEQHHNSEDLLPEFVIIHTPGHSPGSLSLLYTRECGNKHRGVIFTGDTLAYSLREERMSGFPRYGENLRQQSHTLELLLDLCWQVVAPGHGKFRSYINNPFAREEEIRDASRNLLRYSQGMRV